LGGGTGSGALPVFAKMARDAGALTIGVFTLPFRFEGEKKAELARQALEAAKKNLNVFLVFPNEKIFQSLDKNLSFEEGLEAINKTLTQGLEGLVNLIFQPGLINIDFADLKTILEGRGKPAFLFRAEFERGVKPEEIRKKIFQSSFSTCNFRQARQVLFNIVAPPNLSLNETTKASQVVFNQVHPEAKIIFGVSFSGVSPDKIRLLLLAVTGREQKSREGGRPKSDKVSKKRKTTSAAETAAPLKAEKLRRNALQIKEEEKIQQENLAAREQLWDTPAVMRRGLI
jgi:cell division protein FtsZ